MFHAVDRVSIAVEDLDQATGTYQRLLGREPAWRGSCDDGAERTLFALANGSVELAAPARPDAGDGRLRRALEGRGEGVFSLAFAADELERCAKALAGRGLASGAPEGRKGAGASGELRWSELALDRARTRGVALLAVEREAPLEPSAATGDPDAAAAGLDHVVVGSRDPERTRALYGTQLGLRLALDRSFESFGARLLFFRIGGVTVEVAARLAAEPEPDAPDELRGIAYQVPSVPAARDRVAAAGFDVSEVRDGRKAGTLVCTVRSATCSVPTLLIGPG